MQRWAQTIRTGLLALLVPAGLQAAPPVGFKLVAQTDRFTFFNNEAPGVGDKGNLAPESDRYLSKVESLLGTKVPGKVSYYSCPKAEDVALTTGRYATGVASPATAEIYATPEAHDHEIVHMVSAQLGSAGSFFDEGLAVAIGDGGKLHGQSVDRLARTRARQSNLTALMAGFDRMDKLEAYAIAGSFVQHLIKTHGIHSVAQFFSLAKGADNGAAFQTAFGQSFDEAGTAWVRSL